jgi:hypothetical protein
MSGSNAVRRTRSASLLAAPDNALHGRSNAVVTIRMVNANGWGPWERLDCDDGDRRAQELR